MNLDQALLIFIAESRELLEDMESSLLALEQTEDKTELINSIFRAAHTIKGSSGLFSLDHVVAFTHVVENVLDKVRAGTLTIGDGTGAANMIPPYMTRSDTSGATARTVSLIRCTTSHWSGSARRRSSRLSRSSLDRPSLRGRPWATPRARPAESPMVRRGATAIGAVASWPEPRLRRAPRRILQPQTMRPRVPRSGARADGEHRTGVGATR